MRSLARRVLSSRSVKSSVNQPVSETPSIVLVVRRWTHSGCSLTSVEPLISFLVASDQDAVLGAHQIGFDEVGALLDGDENVCSAGRRGRWTSRGLTVMRFFSRVRIQYKTPGCTFELWSQRNLANGQVASGGVA
jgi:hypothetical protein